VDNGGNAYTFDGTSWSNAQSIATDTLYSISCPSASFCAAVDSAGNAYTFDGTSWSNAQSIATDTLYSISCPSTSFCAAEDGSKIFTVK
jgi:hypothetical protein